MRKLGMPTVILTTLVLIGCGGGGSASPKDAFASFKQAMVEKDFKTIWNMLSAESKRLMNDEAKDISGAAVKAEGPARTALEKTARLIDLDISDLKTINGEGLFVATLKMATASDDKKHWDKVSRMELADVDETEIDKGRVKVSVKIDDEVQDRPLSFVKEGAEWKIDIGSEFQGLKDRIGKKADEPSTDKKTE